MTKPPFEGADLFFIWVVLFALWCVLISWRINR